MNSVKISAPLILAVLITAGCSRESSESGSSDTNSLPATNYVATNSAAIPDTNNWASARNEKNELSNLVVSAKGMATNAWEATKETGTNIWQKTEQVFGGGEPTNEVSTNYFGYDYSRKDAFVAEAKTSLDALDQKSAKLTAKVQTASDNVKAELQEQLKNVNDRRASLGQKYEAVQNATQDNWEDMKAAFVKSYFDLKATVKAEADAVAAKF